MRLVLVVLGFERGFGERGGGVHVMLVSFGIVRYVILEGLAV